MLLWWNGRHEGLKILWDVSLVPVRVRPAVQKLKNYIFIKHMKKLFIIAALVTLASCSNETTSTSTDTTSVDSTCCDSLNTDSLIQSSEAHVDSMNALLGEIKK